MTREANKSSGSERSPSFTRNRFLDTIWSAARPTFEICFVYDAGTLRPAHHLEAEWQGELSRSP